MKVSDLILKLQKVKNKNAIVCLADHKGYDLFFKKTIEISEDVQDPDSIDIGDDDDLPKWLPKKPFPIVVIE